MKTRRFCPWCGRPLFKSYEKGCAFQCYGCNKDFKRHEVHTVKEIEAVRKIRQAARMDEYWRKEYPHSFRKPYPRIKTIGRYIPCAEGKYDTKSLILFNKDYHFEHGVDQSDVDMVNQCVQAIESTRSGKQPRNGDCIRLTTKYGRYYPKAHLEDLWNHHFSVCEEPYVPFVYPSLTKNGIVCSTSGGAWMGISVKALRYAGKETKTFKAWDRRGMRAGGAVYFEAEVSVWEYTGPGALYGDFSTKNWRMLHIVKNNEKNLGENDCLYSGDGVAFKNEEEFGRFLKTYKGVMFPGNWQNDCVVWCYFEKMVLIEKNEWKKLDDPPGQPVVCGSPTKIRVDDDSHTVIVFYYK